MAVNPRLNFIDPPHALSSSANNASPLIGRSVGQCKNPWMLQSVLDIVIFAFRRLNVFCDTFVNYPGKQVKMNAVSFETYFIFYCSRDFFQNLRRKQCGDIIGLIFACLMQKSP